MADTHSPGWMSGQVTGPPSRRGRERREKGSNVPSSVSEYMGKTEDGLKEEFTVLQF